MGQTENSANEMNPEIKRFYDYSKMVEYYQHKDVLTSQKYIDSCRLVAKSLEETYYMGEVLQMKARDCFMRALPDSALYLSREASEIFQHYPDSIAHYTNEYNIGNIYLGLEEPIKALVQFKKVLRIIDDNFDLLVKNGKDKIDLNRAYCYVSIGMTYDHMGEYGLKLSNMQKGLKIAQKVISRESEVLQAVTLGNLGQTYCELGEYELAESYAIMGMDYKKKLGIENTIGYNYQVLARSAYGRKKYPLALKYIDLSDKYFGETFNSAEININKILRARCFYKQKKHSDAIQLLLDSERLFDEPATRRERIEFYVLLSEIYGANGDFEKALQYSNIAINLKDELYKKSNIDATDEFLSFFEEEEARIDDKLENLKNIQEKEKLELQIQAHKEKQIWMYTLFIVSILCLILIIIVIARGNRRNKKINQELNYSMDEKEILFREVHHRVKNNFQIISSLLNLQQGIEEDSRSKKVLTDAQGRIQSMALVHEMLYRKNEVKKIDFKVYTEELVSSIIHSFASHDTTINYKIEYNHESFDLELTVPLGLILNEAITNSVKYAFVGKEDGEILIQLKPIDQKIQQLVIKDNGIGIPAEYLNGNKETLGIELINILSEQLRGSAKISNNNGTEIIVTFNAID